MNPITINCQENTLEHNIASINNSGCGSTPTNYNLFNIQYFLEKCISSANPENIKSIISNIAAHLSADCKAPILASDRYAAKIKIDNAENIDEASILHIGKSGLNFLNQLGNATTKAVNLIVHITDSVIQPSTIPDCDAYTKTFLSFNNQNHMFWKFSNTGSTSNCSLSNEYENNQPQYSSLVMEEEASIINLWTMIGVGIGVATVAGITYFYNKNYRNSNNTEDHAYSDIEMEERSNALTADNNIHTTEDEVAVDLTGSVLPS